MGDSVLVGIGKLCIEVTSASEIAFISEELCISCGICVKDPSKFVAATISVASAAASKVEEATKPQEPEESDNDMGLSLFD
ncbi:hypothetical protein Tsubulata_022596 [Turnera subulata]|uniref:Uncharacterized protein n=1 Tax=Turnera subulata TaxID=218843 RepID=A0A9Q0FUL5_9ROSI|nr:hypothetical protein Tsubulata_022596 [Turnera subulata]